MIFTPGESISRMDFIEQAIMDGYSFYLNAKKSYGGYTGNKSYYFLMNKNNPLMLR
jgi:hypothetical protein